MQIKSGRFFLSGFPSNQINCHLTMLRQSLELFLLDLGSPSGSQLLAWARYQLMESQCQWLNGFSLLCALRYQVSRSMSAFKPFSQLHRMCYGKAALFMYLWKHYWAAFSSVLLFNELFSKAGDWVIELVLERALIGDMSVRVSSETLQIFLFQSSSAYDKYTEAPGSCFTNPK